MNLHEAAFESLPLGTIKPAGWLKDQLRIQADGLTGHLEEHWADVGPNNGWIGGKGESWERGPYYLDGLLPLAYLLQDDKLIAKAGRWIEWALSSQQDSGMFGPERIESVNNDVNKEQDWWHYMIMLKVFMQYEEATKDPRVVPFMSKFLRYVDGVIVDQPLDGWAQARGAEMLLAIVWLYKKTGDTFLLQLAETVTRQTTDWTDVFRDFPFTRKVEHWDFRTHVVNVAMAIKMPGVLYELTGDEKQREAVQKGIESLMTHHGQAHGMFSGDEWLAGTHPSQGVELCAVVEYMFSMENLVRILGDGRYGDILEKVAFNALPATISADWTSHQYDQQVNQVVCNVANRNWSNGDEANLFGLEPNFGCCTSNMHQGWPKLASHLWMTDRNGGLAVISYAPCLVEAVVGREARATIEVGGDYPFREEVQITLSVEQTERFGISFRIPAWCKMPELQVNGEIVTLQVLNGFAKVIREWDQESLMTLKLPMEVRMNSRNLFAVNVERGPLVYVLPIGENWQQLLKREKFHDWEVYPTTAWKFGLVSGAGFDVKLEDIPQQPFDAAKAPVRLSTKGQLVRNWRMEGNNADSPPINPDTKGQPIVELELVPYGSTRLRIGEFPLIGKRNSFE